MPHSVPVNVSDDILNVPVVPRVFVLLKRGEVSRQPPAVSLWPPQLAAFRLLSLSSDAGGGVLPQAVFAPSSLHGLAEWLPGLHHSLTASPHPPPVQLPPKATLPPLTRVPPKIPSWLSSQFPPSFPRSQPAPELHDRKTHSTEHHHPSWASVFKSLLECAGKGMCLSERSRTSLTGFGELEHFQSLGNKAKKKLFLSDSSIAWV